MNEEYDDPKNAEEMARLWGYTTLIKQVGNISRWSRDLPPRFMDITELDDHPIATFTDNPDIWWDRPEITESAWVVPTQFEAVNPCRRRLVCPDGYVIEIAIAGNGDKNGWWVNDTPADTRREADELAVELALAHGCRNVSADADYSRFAAIGPSGRGGRYGVENPTFNWANV